VTECFEQPVLARGQVERQRDLPALHVSGGIAAGDVHGLSLCEDVLGVAKVYQQRAATWRDYVAPRNDWNVILIVCRVVMRGAVPNILHG
jgi:hypothetical protein